MILPEVTFRFFYAYEDREDTTLTFGFHLPKLTNDTVKNQSNRAQKLYENK